MGISKKEIQKRILKNEYDIDDICGMINPELYRERISGFFKMIPKEISMAEMGASQEAMKILEEIKNKKEKKKSK